MFVIRSMSTTDMRPGQPPKPYHVYLLKPEKRTRAYWATNQVDAAKFASIETALRDGKQLLPHTSFDVVPCNDRDVPTYWDARAGGCNARVIGNAIEH